MKDLLMIINRGMIHNCLVTSDDIWVAKEKFGPNLGALKGRTVHRKGDHVPSLVANVPYNIIKTHQNVTLAFDNFFVSNNARHC